MRRVIVGLGLLLSSACVGPDRAEPRTTTREPEPTAMDEGRDVAEDRTGPLELAVDGASPRASIEALREAPGRELASSHADRAAWSADGRTFVHCRPAGSDCTACRLFHLDGTSEALEAGTGCTDAAPSTAALESRLGALEPLATPTRWSQGSEVVLVVETRQLEATNAGEPRAMLKLGARRRAGGPPAWLLHVDPCEGCGTDQQCAAVAHFDALVPSPRGDRLAVLLHQRSSGGDESTRVELLDSERIGAAARAPASQAPR
ncbi:hypothetical protein [Paraliomyxa miuraensis]|uniref:hypothetical protein n=1 Tax=Paraliomyxa miuraensis TaxID=376150 RepID=UPI00224FB70B|nr:hypothetical protein [Paraliomyxa miuraensis]MCX4242823.1 hypothetical protein [Paraliomyxa miuraensis]